MKNNLWIIQSGTRLMTSSSFTPQWPRWPKKSKTFKFSKSAEKNLIRIVISKIKRIHRFVFHSSYQNEKPGKRWLSLPSMIELIQHKPASKLVPWMLHFRYKPPPNLKYSSLPNNGASNFFNRCNYIFKAQNEVKVKWKVGRRWLSTISSSPTELIDVRRFRNV